MSDAHLQKGREDEVPLGCEHIPLASSDGSSTLHACVWWPEGGSRERPRGVVQVIHGMAEHVGRYDEFARFLAARDYVVCGDDHIGHGLSSEPASRGHIPLAAGAGALVEDEHRLRKAVSARVPAGTPHVLFGHSMGSFIARAYLTRHAEGLSGAILCGTGSVPVPLSRTGNALARAIAAVRGERHRSKLVDGMGAGAYSRSVEGPTGFEWLSRDEGNVRRYLDDEACGFLFSVGGYAALTSLTAESCSRAAARRVPRDLPLLFVSGAEDPVGDCGRGVRRAARLYLDAGLNDVSVRIYEGMRHEILNEGDRGRVCADVASWIAAHEGKETGS